MKSHRYLGYGLAIGVGLTLGLMIRSVMKPDAYRAISPPEIRSVSALPLKTTAPSLSLAGIIDLMDRKGRTKRTLEEDALLKSSLVDLNPEAMKELAEALGGLKLSHGDREAIGTLFSAWGERAPLDALAGLSSLPHYFRLLAKNCIMNAWVLVDPDAAFAHIDKENPPIPPGDRFDGGDPTRFLWQRLAKVAPEEALSRANEISDQRTRIKREDQIIGTMSYHNPKAALDWLAKNREGENLKDNLAKLISGWGTQNPGEAFAYLLELPSDLQSQRAYENLATSMFNEVDMAITMIDQVPDTYRNSFTKKLGEMTVRHEPEKAASIIEKITQGNDREEAYNRVASFWTHSDPVQAAEWLTTLPRSPSRDSAIRRFAQQLLPHDPETAVTWLTHMDHSNRGLHNSLLQWLKQDPVAAQKWMKDQPEERLPEIIKQQVTDLLEN